MNYKTYPTDYVQELKKKGNRKKARAFQEYWDDMEHGEHNSIRFYAQSWDAGKSTAQRWVDEFNREVDLFLAHWDIRNKQHYTYAKKSMGHQRDEWDTNKTQNIGVLEDGEVQHWDKALNIYNNNNTAWVFDKDFNDLFFIYGANTKYKGKKEEAFAAFKNIDVDINLLKLAAVRYLHDKDTEGKRYNLTNFLKNEIYISYLPTKIKLTLNGVERVGKYNSTTKLFVSDVDNFVGEISASRLVELYQSGALEYLR